MNIKHHQKCRICGNPHLETVIDFGKMPFQGCFKQEGYKSPPTREMENHIVRCDTSKYEDACGLVQTKHSVDPEILYRNYWYESGISQTMRDHLSAIVGEIINIQNSGSIDNLSVLDIASNDNTLLRTYKSDHGLECLKIGIDPSNIAACQTDEDIEVINETFPCKKLDIKHKSFNIITSIACFYDVNDPKAFAESIKLKLKDDGIWCFEVAYLPTMLKKLSYDSCVNEHTIHYNITPLEFLFKEVGLKLFKARKTETNGGSIICFVCHADCDLYDTCENKNDLEGLRLEEFDSKLDESETYENFSKRIKEHGKQLADLLKQIKMDGKSVHLYGASTKMNTILSYSGIGTDLIEFAAERSKNKIGGETLSGIKIISEEKSRSMNPDYYLVGPYHFKEEILKREAESIRKGIRFIFPLPNIEIH